MELASWTVHMFQMILDEIQYITTDVTDDLFFEMSTLYMDLRLMTEHELLLSSMLAINMSRILINPAW